VDLLVEAHVEAPAQIVLDLDDTDDPVHGNQENHFFHGHYREYCYLPLYIFCGEHLLCAPVAFQHRFGRRSTGRSATHRSSHSSVLARGQDRVAR
jgi:hypothetical protein